MEVAGAKRIGLNLLVSVVILYTLPLSAQIPDIPEVPPNFKLDMETAAQLRPQLLRESVAPAGRYSMGDLVLKRLLQWLPAGSPKFAWQLRIVENDQLNAYSSPDGGIFVESGLARLAGTSSGLWAALLSHEIAHVLRRDWARRYIYEKYLDRGSGTSIVLGDPALPASPWIDSEKASADLGQFCRELELQADHEGLMLMARAGYHPDFVPALHHLLHAQGVQSSKSLYAMHPCWEERDRELARAYTEASIEFEHRWHEWYATPGGNPPVVVFAQEPVLRKTSEKQWLIQVPMRCENLVGAVEVVLRANSPRTEIAALGRLPETQDHDQEIRQLTGCTSPTTTVTFSLGNIGTKRTPGTHWTDLYVVDAWGMVLARADLPKLPK